MDRDQQSEEKESFHSGPPFKSRFGCRQEHRSGRSGLAGGCRGSTIRFSPHFYKEVYWNAQNSGATIATGRNIAGVHWRSDAYESLRLGQKVAISDLQEQTKIHNEANPYYIFRGFDGERIVVRDGGVYDTV